MRTERLCGTLLALACAAAIAGCAGSKVRSAVLGPEQAEVVAEQCSRPNPPRYESTWLPGLQDIQQLEQDLPALNALAPAGGAVQVGNAGVDGGSGAWGAVYDPASRDFSGFAFNGRHG